VMQCVTVSCGVLQCVVVCCSVLQHVCGVDVVDACQVDQLQSVALPRNESCHTYE